MRSLAIIGWTLTVLGLATAGRAQVPSPQQQAMAAATFDQKLGAQIPLNTRFTNESGDDLARVIFWTIAPLCWRWCTTAARCFAILSLRGLFGSLREVSLTPGEDFKVIIISIDHRETPEIATNRKALVLKEYGRPETSSGWHMLTGTEQSVRTIAAAIGYNFRFDLASQQFAHPSGLLVITPDGRAARYLFGVTYARRDMRLSLVEASEGKIGSVADEILLRCYQYDPASGKYGFAIMTSIRAAGVTTVVVLVGLVGWFIRRERRQNQLTQEDTADRLHNSGERDG